MASSDPELVRLYLSRLMGSFAPSELGTPQAEAMVNDLTNHLTRPFLVSSSTLSLPQLLEQYHKLFYGQNRGDDWKNFQAIVNALAHTRSAEEFTRNLVLLSRLSSPELSSQSDTRFRKPRFEFENDHRENSPLAVNSNEYSQQTNLTMSELIDPHYKSLDESILLDSLRHILVGQDTQILIFSRDQKSIEIPDSVNTSYTQLLTQILEPALLWKSLHLFLVSRKGEQNSPIKTAFLSFVDVYLVHYADYIECLFRTTPTSLIALLDSLEGQIHSLRFLGHLKTRLVDLNGFDFLLEVFKFSQFGDPSIAEFASKLFHDVSVPYYQYLENWIIKGDLIDEHGEFFVYFDKTENHINDIIKYNPKKIPTFLHLDDEVFMKIFQVGKTLVFLDKYCKELDWVNNFSSRYFQFIFTSHKGLQTMSTNMLQVMINVQYDEVIKYFMLVSQSKFSLFSHFVSIKRVMLMESSNFIDTINERGSQMFSEPASSLTSVRLSGLLVDSISLSSMKNMPLNYQRRIDARILDLSHGTIGWDVFTLGYNIPEPPLEALLNYKDQNVQYLRLFNFLWGLKHYQFLLKENFVQFQDYNKNHMRQIRTMFQGSSVILTKSKERHLKWLERSLRVICLVRHRISILIDTILNFVSFDLIENSFNVHIIRKLFKTFNSQVPGLKKGFQGGASRLSILDSGFLQDRNEMSLLNGLQATTSVDQNTVNLTIDDLTATHTKYLQSVSECKLLREDVHGRHSGKSFVHQIFDLLEIAYTYLRSSEEFGTSLNAYVSFLRLKPESIDFDDDWDNLHHRLNSVKSFIQTELYTDRFQPWLKAFAHDMRAEADLKELSKMI